MTYDQSTTWELLYSEHLDCLTKRFAHALDACGFDRVLIFSGAERYVARDDQAYPYRAEPYFKQWAPLSNAHGSVLEIRSGRRPKLVFVENRDFWYEPPQSPSGYWAEHFDIETVADPDAAITALKAGSFRTAVIGETGAALPGGFEVNNARLLAILDFDRAAKTGYEIRCMAEASRIGVAGHMAVAAAFAPGTSEFSLSQLFCAATELRETDLPYPSIVALNEHAAVLHYQNHRRQAPASTRSLLIDAGGIWSGYASDITRSYAAEPGLYRDLITAMDSLQQELCAEVTVGRSFVELNERAHEILAAVLHEHGLVACSADEAYETGLTRTFLPHGLGHLLGLQVHDAGGRQISPEGEIRPPPSRHPHLRLTRELAPGFVLTIEPGIYFIPSLLGGLEPDDRRRINWAAVESLSPCGGIRIEDNLLVEFEGARNLTREAYAALGRVGA